MESAKKEYALKAAGLFLFSLIVQLLLLPYFFRIPYFSGISEGFTDVANNYLQGNGFTETIYAGARTFYQPEIWEAPGYSAFIIAIFSAFGADTLYVKLAQAAIFSLVPLALYLFFRKADQLGDKHAFILGILAAAYVPTLRVSSSVLSEFLFGVLLLGSTLLILDKRYLFAGAVFGASVLTRDFGLLFIPAFVVYFSLNSKSKGDYKRFFTFMAAFLLIMTPWLARTYSYYGHFAVAAPKTGMALWEGIGEFDVDKRFDAPTYDAEVMARENALSFKYPAPFERDQARVAASMKIITENPAWYLSVMARRLPQLLLMNTGDPITGELKREILHNFSFGGIQGLAGRMFSGSGLILLFMWMEQVAVYFLAILGGYYVLKLKDRTHCIFLLVAATPLALIIMHVEPRYFTPVNYFLLFLAVYGIKKADLKNSAINKYHAIARLVR